MSALKRKVLQTFQFGTKYNIEKVRPKKVIKKRRVKGFKIRDLFPELVADGQLAVEVKTE